MDVERLSQPVREAMEKAQQRARRADQQQVDVGHLLLALLEQEPSAVASLLKKADVDVNALKRRLEDELKKLPRVTGAGGEPEHVYISPRLNRVFDQAEQEANQAKEETISPRLVLLAMTQDKGPTGRILHEMGLTRERLAEVLEKTHEALERYGRDLTE